MQLALALAVAGVLTYIGTEGLAQVMAQGNAVRTNYQGEPVPTAVGLAFLVGSLVGIGLLVLWSGPERSGNGYTLIIALLGAGLLGLLDDLIGQTQIKGFRGHIKALLSGNVTTGAVKALGGGALAFFVAASGPIPTDRGPVYFGVHWLVSAVLIALATNFLNLADLRPGRAGKAFLALAALGVLLIPKMQFMWILPVLVSVAVYLPGDLRADFMMGDTGANVLGIAAGAILAWWAPFGWKLALVLVLLGLHYLAETVSFSRIIDENALLRMIDGWGRRQGRR